MKALRGYGYTGTCAHGDKMITDTIDHYYAPVLLRQRSVYGEGDLG